VDILIADSDNAAQAAQVNRDAAHRLGLELMERPGHTEAETQAVLAQVRKGEVDGSLVALHSHAWNLLGVITEAASHQGILNMFADTFMVERGGLASYGPDSYRSSRQAARLVDKILKGGEPATTPVEMNSDIELTINLKAAKALGLTIPPAMLSRAEWTAQWGLLLRGCACKSNVSHEYLTVLMSCGSI
jgi:putative ABC transport system substrate-binding protein